MTDYTDIIKRLESAESNSARLSYDVVKAALGPAIALSWLDDGRYVASSLDAAIALAEREVGRATAIEMLASATLADDWDACHREADALVPSVCRVLLIDLFRALQAQESAP